MTTHSEPEATPDAAPGVTRSGAALLSHRQVRRILPAAVMFTWLGPFSMDAYSPAFPAIQSEFATSDGMVQATLATTLIGLSVGQLIVGPLSDRFGRRRPLTIGLAGYVVASVLCSFAWSIEVLIGARLLQGFSAAAGIAVARAVARDVHSGATLARFYSLLAASTALAPMIAPILGAGLLELGLSWRFIFGLTLALGVVGLGLVVFVLPETHPDRIGGRTPPTPAERARRKADGESHLGLWSLLRRRHVFVSALVLGSVGAAMIAQLAGLSFYLQTERGLGPGAYSAIFAVNAAGLVLANNVNRLLLRRFTAQRLLSVATPVMLLAALTFAALLRAGAPLPVALPALFAFMSCWGFVMPNAVSVGMAVERHAAGRASAILGVAQFGFSAFVAPVVGILPAVLGVPSMAVVMVICLTVAVTVQLVSRVRLPRRPREVPVVPQELADSAAQPTCRAAG